MWESDEILGGVLCWHAIHRNGVVAVVQAIVMLITRPIRVGRCLAVLQPG
jgi:hypothetical protein